MSSQLSNSHRVAQLCSIFYSHCLQPAFTEIHVLSPQQLLAITLQRAVEVKAKGRWGMHSTPEHQSCSTQTWLLPFQSLRGVECRISSPGASSASLRWTSLFRTSKGHTWGSVNCIVVYGTSGPFTASASEVARSSPRSALQICNLSSAMEPLTRQHLSAKLRKLM